MLIILNDDYVQLRFIFSIFDCRLNINEVIEVGLFE